MKRLPESTPLQMPRPLEVVRVYGAPEEEGSNRAAGWRWELALPGCANDDGVCLLSQNHTKTRTSIAQST